MVNLLLHDGIDAVAKIGIGEPVIWNLTLALYFIFLTGY